MMWSLSAASYLHRFCIYAEWDLSALPEQDSISFRPTDQLLAALPSLSPAA